ncbi:MAG: PASTA domain-containing protein [Clostridia bacterium]|nr:PASTA domain-containing protein [Clostridia bacterium]
MGVKANRYKNRLLLVCLAMILAFSIIVGALFYWQILAADTLQRKALGQWTSTTTVAASRGTIYDATGEALAISAASKTLNSKPKKLSKSGYSAEALTTMLVQLFGGQYSYESLYKKINYDPDKSVSEYIVARHLTEEQAAYIETLDIDGLYLVDDVKRYYPKGSSLVQVLGAVNGDGVGSDGLELKFDKQLRGLTGKLISSTDVSGGQIPGSEQRYIDATNGVNLNLTVDYAIQSFAENVMRACLTDTKAKAVRCIVINPKTGAILAMVNLPDFDPNTATGDEKKTYSRNSCILDTYEPGSTFKIFTLSAALENKTVTESSSFYCPGYHIVDGEKIKCWRTVPHGTQNVAEVLANSCNPAFMQMGLSLGQKKLYEYLYSFGFNTTTGVDFSADQSGIILAPKYVKNTDLARIAFGQSIAVTPLQLLTAACAVINGGILYQPYFVASMTDNEGKVLLKNEPVEIRQVISAQTSATMRSLLENVVAKGGGKNAQVEGYRVGGKTGTAQKYRDGVIVSGVHVGSFFGFAPANDPEIAVLVTVDEAQMYNDYGSVTAAPYAGQIISKILQYRQIKPTEEAQKEMVTVPNLIGSSCDYAASVLKNAGLLVEIDGSGSVISQTPAAGKTVAKYSIIKVTGANKVDTTVHYGID